MNPKTRVFVNGERVRDKRGRFAKGWFKRFIRKVWGIIKISGAVAAVGAVIFIGGMAFAKTSDVQAVTPQTIDLTPQKIESLKSDLVERLSQCESAGNPNIATTYDNNKAGTLKGEDVFSYGVMQWKSRTLKGFAQQRDGSVLSTKEAVILALNNVEAKKLAQYTIFETKGGIYHWANCADKLNLVAEVEAIKKLSK